MPPHPWTLCFVLTKELGLMTLPSHYKRVIILQDISDASARVALQSVPTHKLLLQVTMRKRSPRKQDAKEAMRRTSLSLPTSPLTCDRARPLPEPHPHPHQTTLGPQGPVEKKLF